MSTNDIRRSDTPGEPETDGPPRGRLQGFPRDRDLVAAPGWRGRKTSEIIALQIVRDIVDSGMSAGDRLPPETLMVERFGVGRASLREALRVLEEHGVILIRSGPNGGPVFTGVSSRHLGRTLSLYFNVQHTTFRELIEARMVVEPVMARLAAERADPALLAQLRAAVAKEEGSSIEDRWFLRAALGVHEAIAAVSGNSVLALVGQSLMLLFSDRTFWGAMAPRPERPGVRLAHRRIADAILAGNAGRAERLMREHMADYRNFVEETHAGLLNEVVQWQ